MSPAAFGVESTSAALYYAQAEFFPDMGHAMMLEAGWQALAERIIRWINTTFPAG